MLGSVCWFSEERAKPPTPTPHFSCVLCAPGLEPNVRSAGQRSSQRPRLRQRRRRFRGVQSTILLAYRKSGRQSDDDEEGLGVHGLSLAGDQPSVVTDLPTKHGLL